MENTGIMKHLALLLAGSLILLVIPLIGLYSFFSREKLPQSIIIIPVDPAITRLKNELASQETTYQAQATALEQTLKQQQADFQTQTQELNVQIIAAQKQLDHLKNQEQDLRAQINRLEITRAKRLTSYQTELQQARDKYVTRQAQLQAQLDKAQTELAAVKTQLER